MFHDVLYQGGKTMNLLGINFLDDMNFLDRPDQRPLNFFKNAGSFFF